jgi:hypothetical protein
MYLIMFNIYIYIYIIYIILSNVSDNIYFICLRKNKRFFKYVFFFNFVCLEKKLMNIQQGFFMFFKI